MKACFPVLCARKRVDFSAYRTHHSLANLTKPRPARSRSVEQLEQLVGEQGDHAKHHFLRASMSVVIRSSNTCEAIGFSMAFYCSKADGLR
jgi:hypothetical protein